MIKKISAERVLYLVAIGLLVYMPFHLFLSRWLSLYTGGLGQWDGAKDVVTLCGLFLAVFLALKHHIFKQRWVVVFFVLATLYGFLHLLFYFLNREDQETRSFIVATLFNGRILAYFFIGLVVAQTTKIDYEKVIRILLIVSTITCLFAIAQYFLPKDLMSYFGYTIERGAKPSFFIDDKPDFPRVMSTIRDPNSYGAYLILPILILLQLFISKAQRNPKILIILSLHFLALLLTFSRSAWLGLMLASGVLFVFLYGKATLVFFRKHILLLTVLLGLTVVGLYSFSHTYTFKNIILHSDESTTAADPNELRLHLQTEAIQRIAHNPEGHGPGTAGLASIGNPKSTFLTENYFLQISYEIGLTGLAIFIAVLALIYTKLTHLRHNKIILPLIASFWAYILIGLLIHLWSNEAVAYSWWALAGLLMRRSSNSNNRQETK